jgi:hypothetical protein
MMGLVSVAPDLNVVARFKPGKLPAHVFGSASAWIGPAGGSLKLLDFELVVPAGAVSDYTFFSIKLPLALTTLNRAYAEFGPHHVKFAEPVLLRMPYRGTSADGKSPSIVWWSGTRWVRYQTTLLSDGRIQTATDHFSEFGTEENPDRGVTPVGG